MSWILPPEKYFLLLKNTDCAGCTESTTVSLGVVHLPLYFKNGACDLPIRVSLIGALPSDTCLAHFIPYPDYQLCPPIDFRVSKSDPGVLEFLISLPDTCKLTDAAFLNIEFPAGVTGCDSILTTPQLLITGSCRKCESFNDDGFQQLDLCSSEQLLGRPVIWVDARSCYTAALPRSWGELKRRYYR